MKGPLEEMLDAIRRLCDVDGKPEDLAALALYAKLAVPGVERGRAVFDAEVMLVDALLELVCRFSTTGAQRQQAVAAMHAILDERVDVVRARCARSYGPLDRRRQSG